jgi:hypothetical protein
LQSWIASSTASCSGLPHFSLGLQVADLVVGATLAAQRVPGDASRWFKQLLPRFARHPDTGELEGVGLKTFSPRAKGEEPGAGEVCSSQSTRAPEPLSPLRDEACPVPAHAFIRFRPSGT